MGNEIPRPKRVVPQGVIEWERLECRLGPRRHRDCLRCFAVFRLFGGDFGKIGGNELHGEPLDCSLIVLQPHEHFVNVRRVCRKTSALSTVPSPKVVLIDFGIARQYVESRRLFLANHAARAVLDPRVRCQAATGQGSRSVIKDSRYPAPSQHGLRRYRTRETDHRKGQGFCGPPHGPANVSNKGVSFRACVFRSVHGSPEILFQLAKRHELENYPCDHEIPNSFNDHGAPSKRGAHASGPPILPDHCGASSLNFTRPAPCSLTRSSMVSVAQVSASTSCADCKRAHSSASVIGVSM